MRKVTIRIIASALITSAAILAPLAAGAPARAEEATKAAEPVEIAQASSFKKAVAVKLLKDNMNDIRKIPFLGDTIVGGLIAAIQKLPWKTSPKYGKYLEFKYGKNKKNALTIFNIGSYAGTPRIVFGFSYDGTLSTRGDEKWAQSGIWKFLPGIEVKYPVVFFRVALTAAGYATPVVKGADLKKLPGTLGQVADKAAKLTRTLRLPVGALVLAGWQPKGALATKFELLNLPTQTVYLMAGGGVEAWPPGGHITGRDVDPVLQSWRQARSFARDDKDESGDFVKFKRYLPRASGYLKISIPGKWMNPMTAFDRTAYAEDAVLMVTYTGDAVSWGTIKNLWGHSEYVYAIDIPGILSAEKAKQLDLPDLSFALSTKQFTLADAINAKLGMLTQFTNKTEFLRRLAVMAGSSGTSQASMVQDLFNAPLDKLEALRVKMYAATKSLPLDQIKITNPAFVAYDAKTATYPPSKSFNIYFSASDGVTATGERGPIFVGNGTFEMFGQTLGKTKVLLSPKSGISMYAKKNINLPLGKVLGADLNISGSDEMQVEIKQAHVIMRKKQTWNILGIAKGEAKIDLKLDKSGPKMRVKFDPTSGCAPPIPIKIDVTIKMPTSKSAFNSQIKSLLNGVKFDSGGIMKCAGKIFELGKKGAKYIGKGAVIAGKYVGEGAKEVGGAAVDGANITAKFATAGANEVANFSKNIGNKIGSDVKNAAKKLGKTLTNFSRNVGCSLGFGGCPSRPPAPLRIASPFYCAPGFFYSLEYGRCWATGANMFAFTGLKTNKELCLTAGPAGGFIPMTLSPCTGDLDQQIKVAGNRMTFKYKMDGPVQTLHTPSHHFGRDVQVMAGAPKSPHKFSYVNNTGQLQVKSGPHQLCIRPDPASARANQFGYMDDWAKTAGNAIDVGVSMDGSAYKLGADGHPALFVGGNRWQVLPVSNLTRLDGGLNSLIWAIDKKGRTLKIKGAKVTHMGGGTGVDIGVGGPSGQTAVAVSNLQENKATGYMVYKWDATTSKWVSMKKRGIRVDVDGAGTVWLVNRHGQVWTHAGSWKRFKNVPSGATDISASHTGGVMVTSRDDNIYAWIGKKWIRFAGKAQNISLGPKGGPWVTSNGAAYAFKTAPQIKGWAGIKQPGPFDKSLALAGQNIALETCEEFPGIKTWTAFSPKETKDYALNAGLQNSFIIGWDNLSLHNNDPKHPVWEVKSRRGPPRHDWRHVAGMEFSAVFVNATQFALYNHQSGFCLDNKRMDLGHPTARQMPCVFKGDQLWERKVFPNGHSEFKNVSSGRCLGHRLPHGRNQEPGTNLNCGVTPQTRWDVVDLDNTLPFSRKGESGKPWIAYGGEYAPLTTTREGDIVTITGLLQGGQTNVLATVPKNLAPPKTLIFNVNNNGRSVRLDFGTNGKLNAGAGDKAWVSLSGITYSVAPGKRLALKNKWTTSPHGYGPATATKSGNIVTVSGLIRGGKYNNVMATLPAGYRPKKELLFTGNNNAGQNLMRVYPNGDIRWIRGTKHEGWVSLAGITFAVAPTEGLHLFNGWRNAGKVDAPATVTRQSKMVTIGGIVKSGRWGLFGLLPRGYRPAKRLVFRLNADPNAVRVDILPDGKMQWIGGARPGAISLSGISFPTQEPAFGGKVSLRNKASQRCLESSTTKNAAQFTQYDCDPTNPNLQFSVLHRPGGTWFSLINNTSNGCLTVATASKTRGAPVVQFPCHQGFEQYWKKVMHAGGWFTLQNRNSGLCLNLANGAKPNGSPYDQYPCDGSNPTMLFGHLNPASSALFPKP